MTPATVLQATRTYHFQVWHANHPDFLGRQFQGFPSAHFVHVADLQVTADSMLGALRQTFAHTQHITQLWDQDPAVTLLYTPDPRSTMAGDVLICEGEVYGVAMIGFERLR
ncbi:hypothetical protein [Deinococcus sp. Leaf326]|uniref:hypothetical protein n=1 Tax=Deinococcus sp. Leaf326 TaxID=1736338 RepID=UPI0006FCD4E8|nr:hypothetical protein [Deinococcus sp. Leaf326]KQR35146.1 hypothetical protein ASF71_16325 [Deinococcus sp. Leaf326]